LCTRAPNTSMLLSFSSINFEQNAKLRFWFVLYY